MKTRLSTLLDNELDSDEIPTVCVDLRRSKELRMERDVFALIGDSLRGEEHLHVDLTSRVMAALQNEPVVLAPRKPLWRRHVYAAAASVAGIAVVGVVALSMQRQQSQSLAIQPVALVSTPVVAKEEPKEMSKDMQEYLIAHQAQSAGFYLAGGSSQQIRTVSLVAAGGGR